MISLKYTSKENIQVFCFFCILMRIFYAFREKAGIAYIDIEEMILAFQHTKSIARNNGSKYEEIDMEVGVLTNL